jgi:hypothetical protein
MEQATQFWAPFLLPSLSLAANSGEHTQARNHHSTKRGHFSHAAIMHACMDQSWKYFSIATACRIGLCTQQQP